MTESKKSWQEKLHDSHGLPRVEPIPEKMAQTLGPGTICIPAPLEVDEVMRQVPQGGLITINQIRAAVAARHQASIG